MNEAPKEKKDPEKWAIALVCIFIGVPILMVWLWAIMWLAERIF